MLRASKCNADITKQLASIKCCNEQAVLSQQHISPQTPTGATLGADGATFRVWAPEAGAVYLHGIFGGQVFDQLTDDRLLQKDERARRQKLAAWGSTSCSTITSATFCAAPSAQPPEERTLTCRCRLYQRRFIRPLSTMLGAPSPASRTMTSCWQAATRGCRLWPTRPITAPGTREAAAGWRPPFS